ncbi:protein jag [Fusobacterium polymorphum]|mgnify:FL=1|uniref:Jag family protein n=1 Tax=Fusobacterium nucleatum subsp. polymorphum TaxID=76857 RepID=UPI0011C48953|nr:MULTISPECIES: R3H domain-containing nucleic acid-binding protein [Fusobacterium]QYR60198.1 KH domain-containing protein [Fusobacterium polymorphum]QYR62511.1 KH domain-containing protein [Fusobacterium polymorphum]WDF26259.1 KH domain-containing protein [Fusobacterium nucleatum]
MEKTIEIKAIDKEKALKRALNILGVELTENEAVEIVEKVKPRKKFFGLFGTEPGTYEISIKTKEKREEVKEKKNFTPKTEKVEKNPKYEKQEKIEKAEKVETSHKNNAENIELEKEITEKVSFFVEKMKLDIKFKLKRIKERVYVVEFFGKDNALVIGQKGKTLNSFEYLLNSMIKNCRIEIDVERFKEKRNETLRILAKRMAEKVSKYGKTVRLNAMPPRERKIIHEVVNKYPDLDTYSEGRDPKRYIVIKKKRG